jgi:hypothetical protein
MLRHSAGCSITYIRLRYAAERYRYRNSGTDRHTQIVSAVKEEVCNFLRHERCDEREWSVARFCKRSNSLIL